MVNGFCRAAVCVLCLALLCSCQPQSSPGQDVQFTAMDTFVHLTAYGDRAAPALTDAQAYMLQLERLVSVTDPDSELYAANHSSGQPVPVSEETAQLLNFALTMSHRTDGAMDPTVYPLVRAWGFTADQYRVPTQTELDELLGLVGTDSVRLRDGLLSMDADMMLDLGSVAKGWAGDRMAELLRGAGVESALLRLGGNIQAVGTRPDGSDWLIGIQDPDGGILATLTASDCAVVTSGSYHRSFTMDGETYCHIIDPSTGRPARAGLISVTVTAPSGALCDALSTALFVMGPELAARHWRQHRDFEAVFLLEDGSVSITAGLEDRFALADGYTDRNVQVLE